MATITTTDNILNNEFDKLCTLNAISANTNEEIIFTHEDYTYGDIDDYNSEYIWGLYVITRNKENQLVFRFYERKIIHDVNGPHGPTEYQEMPITEKHIEYVSEICFGSSHRGNF